MYETINAEDRESHHLSWKRCRNLLYKIPDRWSANFYLITSRGGKLTTHEAAYCILKIALIVRSYYEVRTEPRKLLVIVLS